MIREEEPGDSELLIAIEQEAAAAYLARIITLLKKPSAHLYIDTSFLMWLSKLLRQARAEFRTWAASILSGRLHVPMWCSRECFKHRLEGRIAADFISELKSFDKDAASSYDFAVV